MQEEKTEQTQKKEQESQPQATGIFWTPRGGNNQEHVWSSCHIFRSVTKESQTSVIVDIGQNEFPKSFEDGSFDKVVPALDDCIEVPSLTKHLDPNLKAEAILLTHGHSDHIAGIYEYAHIGAKLPPIYATEYTLNTLKKGLIDNGVEEKKWPEMKAIEQGETLKIGNMTIETFAASHSIPGCLSFKLSNEEASIFHSGDTKADEIDFITGKQNDFSKISEKGQVDLMTFDSTSVHLEGHATYETEVFEAYKELFEKNKGKQIITLLPPAHSIRIANVLNAANAAGVDVVIDGGASMETNLFALQSAGYDIKKENPNISICGAGAKKENTIVITTGIYQEKNSPFIQHLNGENQDFFMQEDAVIIAPFTEQSKQFHDALKEKLDLSKVTLITACDAPKIYGSGHAQEDDFIKIAQAVKPNYVIPIHCSKEMAKSLNELAKRTGYQTLKTYPCNGTTVHTHNKEGCQIVAKKQPHWLGLNHSTDKEGNEIVTFKKRSDNGYSSCDMRTITLAKKQKEASLKIADYNQKRKTNLEKNLISRKYYGR